MKKNKKDSKLILSPTHLKDLNHWRDQLLALEKSYYSKDPEKQRTIKNMLNKYLDDVIDYNKKVNAISKNNV
jgi:hypothetical protein